tara:strand:- start:29 stop:649 length:621 start_codon:yes stop_codon:yes gene_type:complete
MGKYVMSKKYKLLSDSVIENLVSFLDEIQFEAAANTDKDSMHVVNFCSWAISELLNSPQALIKPKKKSREDYVDETFMDWNLPEMTDDEYEKLVDQFDAFLRGWEKDYNRKNKNNPKKKPIKERPYKPHIEDVAEYMSLEEIEEFLLDDPELTDQERFELYYDERERIKEREAEKKRTKGANSMDKIMKDLNIKPSDWKPGDNEKK